MNFVLAEVQTTQWILLAVIAVLIVLYPIFVYLRNKKDKERFQELNDNLKVGDKVVTGSGIYGTIVAVDVKEQGKILVLETGNEENKGYVSVDVLAVYNVFKDGEEIQQEQDIVESEEKAEVEENVEESDAVATEHTTEKSVQKKKTKKQ